VSGKTRTGAVRAGGERAGATPCKVDRNPREKGDSESASIHAKFRIFQAKVVYGQMRSILMPMPFV
jgi:hypothetical protein